ncbi:MAG: WD40 repeat domain-containing protein [Steroidobacterales bacterium]
MRAAAGQLRLRRRLELDDYPVDAAWASDGKSLIVATGASAITLISIEQEIAARPIGAHAGGALAVAWQKAGNLFVSSGQDGAVLLWDRRTLESRTIHAGNTWSEHLAFADNGRLLAVSTGRTLRVFDAGGALRAVFESHPGVIAALAWRPKSVEVAVAGNGGMRIHRVEPQLETRDYPVRGACLTASWNADGRILAAGMQDGRVQLWHVASGTQSQMQGYEAKVSATEWSGNGRYLATAAGSSLVVWDFSGKGPEGSRPIQLRSHSERISALACRPVGTWLVSAARDRRLLLWHMGASDTPQDAHLLSDECTLLRYARNGERLAVADARGGLSIFES